MQFCFIQAYYFDNSGRGKSFDITNTDESDTGFCRDVQLQV